MKQKVFYDRLIEQYKIKKNIIERLKEKNQMNWIQEMNNIQNCVEEVVSKVFINEIWNSEYGCIQWNG